jgi:putative FmdB family regulatory protein
MPVYDYVCNDCHKTFELILALKEHEINANAPSAAVRTWSKKRPHTTP